MQAVVVYESVFGNTREIAYAIAAGLSEIFDVTVIPASQAYPSLYYEADLLVVGGPTHLHGMSRPSTRQDAAKQAEQVGGRLALEPYALREGVREMLATLSSSRGHGLAAAFDTRRQGSPAFTGRASKPISRSLRRQGYELIAKPESFLVTRQNALCGGEQERARTWGAALGASLSLAAEQSSRS